MTSTATTYASVNPGPSTTAYVTRLPMPLPRTRRVQVRSQTCELQNGVPSIRQHEKPFMVSVGVDLRAQGVTKHMFEVGAHVITLTLTYSDFLLFWQLTKIGSTKNALGTHQYAAKTFVARHSPPLSYQDNVKHLFEEMMRAVIADDITKTFIQTAKSSKAQVYRTPFSTIHVFSTSYSNFSQ